VTGVDCVFEVDDEEVLEELLEEELLTDARLNDIWALAVETVELGEGLAVGVEEPVFVPMSEISLVLVVAPETL
jgi:hypothetical protein